MNHSLFIHTSFFVYERIPAHVLCKPSLPICRSIWVLLPVSNELHFQSSLHSTTSTGKESYPLPTLTTFSLPSKMAHERRGQSLTPLELSKLSHTPLEPLRSRKPKFLMTRAMTVANYDVDEEDSAGNAAAAHAGGSK